MILNSKIQYGILILREVKTSDGIRAITLKEIGDKYNLSLNFLEQVARNLRINGLIKSRRGPGGGYLPGDKILTEQELKPVYLIDIYKALSNIELKSATENEDAKAIVASIYDAALHNIGGIVVC